MSTSPGIYTERYQQTTLGTVSDGGYFYIEDRKGDLRLYQRIGAAEFDLIAYERCQMFQREPAYAPECLEVYVRVEATES